MIDHKNKIIFVHIPRTGGSSLEIGLIGREWSTVDNSTKHMTASATKNLYKKYWDNYIKISIIRNPFDRAISLFTCAHRTVYCKPYKPDFEYFLQHFKPAGHEAQEIQCCNILNESMDYIFNTATLQNDFNNFCIKENINAKQLVFDGKTPDRKPYQQYYNNHTRQLVSEMWKDDIREYGFEFEEE